jgi:dual specificity phosphatase 3
MSQRVNSMEPRELFNALNNFFPVVPLYIDFPINPRVAGASPPSSLVLRRSVRLSAAALQSGQEDVLAALRTTPFMLAIMVTPRAGDAEEEEEVVSDAQLRAFVDRLQASRGSNLLWAATIDRSQFEQQYGQCASLFEETDPERRKVAGFRSVVYPSEILSSRLYLGDFENGMKPSHLTPLGITAVVDATNVQSSKENAVAQGIRYLSVDVDDHPDGPIEDHFEAVVAFVRDELSQPNKRVLIHCRAGYSRSPTLVMVVLMSLYGYRLRDALQLVMQARPTVCPNPGFCDKLIAYEARQFPEEGPSFAHRTAMMELIGRWNVMWSPPVETETELDRRPIRPRLVVGAEGGPHDEQADQGDSYTTVLRGKALDDFLASAGAYPTPVVDADDNNGTTPPTAATSAAIKRPFLKRKR